MKVGVVVRAIGARTTTSKTGTDMDAPGNRIHLARIALCAVVATMLGLAAWASRADAKTPPLLWQTPTADTSSGPGAGELSGPTAVAVDPATGDVFVGNQINNRIDEFTAWGEFVKGFGWGVAATASAEELQVCTRTTGCKAGVESTATGHIGAIRGIAIANDRVYVAEPFIYRVQVFTTSGELLYTLGGKVNKTATEENASRAAEQNICPASGHPNDVCQPAVKGTGPGEFEELPYPSDLVAIKPGGGFYVGGTGHIDEFTEAGEFVRRIPFQGTISNSATRGLETDEAGSIYASLTISGREGSSTVFKLNANGESIGPSYHLGFDPPAYQAEFARTLAIGASGNLYVVNDTPAGSRPTIAEFEPSGVKLMPTKEEEEAAIRLEEPFPFGLYEDWFSPIELFGLAANGSANPCGADGDDLYGTYWVSTQNGTNDQSLLRAWGPPPDPALCQPPAAPPVIEETYVTSVGPEGAKVEAKINPRFWGGGAYYVQYGVGKCSEGECGQDAPAPPGLPIHSEAGVGVGSPAALNGLSSGTTYHFRFVARTDGGGPTVGPEETFTTQPLTLPSKDTCPNLGLRSGFSQSLPDCRAYEMVSPIEKEGGDVAVVNTLVTEVPARLDQISESGERLTYSAYRAFGGAKTAPYSSQYLSSRGGAGWTTDAISPPRVNALQSVLETGDTEFGAFSSDLCQGWLRLAYETKPQLDPSELVGFPNLFRRNNCAPGAGSYEALTTVSPPHMTTRQYFAPQVQGFSADGRCTAFRAPDTLTAEAPVLPRFEEENILYENCGGSLRLVAVLPDGSPSQSPSTAGITNNSVLQQQQRGANIDGAVSKDGSKVYWTAQDFGPGSIYLRINADRAQSVVSGGKCTEPEKACTLPVSELVSSQAARFWTGSTDGTRAFFSVGERLYEYTATNPKNPKATLIAEGVADPMGMLGASKDLSHLYFASKDVLAPGAVKGGGNLYLYERGESTRFIGVLDPTDLNSAPGVGNSMESKAISYKPGDRAVDISADGSYVAFMSSAPLTGFDSTDQRNGAADREVFLYDAAAEGGRGRLLCVSCDPSGARPLGVNVAPSLAAVPTWAAARIPTWASALSSPDVLGTEGPGVRLFFDSFVPLVPHDTNGTADVYEWESAGGQLACEEAGAERYVAETAGCLSLISSGQSRQASEFIAADPSGRDIFFATGQGLVPQDPGLIDIYDAREGGGFPAPAPRAAACEGEACQSAPEAPNDPTPASSAFAGAGNVKEPKHREANCVKGKVRRNGRCASKRKPRKPHRHQRRRGPAGHSHDKQASGHKRSHR